MTESTALGAKVRSGLVWSALNNITLRLGTLIVGIFLARVLDPHSFGVFAIAATVQTVLMSLSELGLAADLVRHGRFAERAPTVATLSLASSTLLTAVVWFGASEIAASLGDVDAAPVVRTMSLTLLLAGIAVVPYAQLQRGLQQKALFGIELVAFVVSTGLSIGLALVGWGAMAIAVGRLAAMVAVVVLEFVLTRTVPRFGWNRDIAGGALRFGLPLAAAGLVSLMLLSIDNVFVGRLHGAGVLGLYVLAFNVSSWPSSIIGTAVRAVAMPAFARQYDAAKAQADESLVRASSLAWAAAVPVSAVLGLLSVPVISVLYGSKWHESAQVLTWLAALGALRIITDVWVAYLTAAGRSGLLLACQVVWLVALTPTMWWAVSAHGLVGAGLAHVVVAGLVVLPTFLLALRLAGAPVAAIVRSLLAPVAAVLPAVVAGALALDVTSEPWLQLLLGGSVVAAVYLALMGRRLAGLLGFAGSWRVFVPFRLPASLSSRP